MAKSQVALAPSKFVGCLGSISEVASNWPRQECLVDCLSLIRTGHSVGEVFLLLRRRCMEETSGIEDGLAASSFYTAGFLHCVALLGSSRAYVSLSLPVAPRSIQV